MMRDDEIKLKVATTIDEAVGEKKKTRRRLLVWTGSACVTILIASIVFALYQNSSSILSQLDLGLHSQPERRIVP